MTPSERLRRLLKPIPRPGLFLDLALGSEYAKRAITTQLRADKVAVELRMFFAGQDLPPELEEEAQRRATLFQKRYRETAASTHPDWSPLAAALESIRDDLQTGRYLT